jgi:hypothetical protein
VYVMEGLAARVAADRLAVSATPAPTPPGGDFRSLGVAYISRQVRSVWYDGQTSQAKGTGVYAKWNGFSVQTAVLYPGEDVGNVIGLPSGTRIARITQTLHRQPLVGVSEVQLTGGGLPSFGRRGILHCYQSGKQLGWRSGEPLFFMGGVSIATFGPFEHGHPFRLGIRIRHPCAFAPAAGSGEQNG